MTWLDSLLPKDPADDDRPGVGPFKFNWSWMVRAARVHDNEDELISAGLSPMSYRENDERFYRACVIEISQLNPTVTPQTARAYARFVLHVAWPVIRAYRFLRRQR